MKETLTSRAREATIQEQVHDYQTFRTHEELEEYLTTLGLGESSPKTIIWSYLENDTCREQPDETRREVTVPYRIGTLLENLADTKGFMADEPNDFTLGMVLTLAGGRQVAIKYKSEECEVVERFEDIEDLEREREFEYIREFEVAVCNDHTQLLWDFHLVSY